MKAAITIAQAAERAGVQTYDLRRWELVYGWPVPIRDPDTQYRRYDEATVEQIRRVAERHRAGVPLRDLIRDGLPYLPTAPEPGSVAHLTEQVQMLRACLRMPPSEYWSETGRRMRAAAMGRGDQATIADAIRAAEVEERDREIKRMAKTIAELQKQLEHERTLRMQFMGQAR